MGASGICSHLEFTEVKKGQRDGVEIFEPVEFATWDRIHGQLCPYAKSLIDVKPNRQKKQDLQEFYYPATSEVEGLKDAWRYHVMQTRRSNSAEDAKAVCDPVRGH